MVLGFSYSIIKKLIVVLILVIKIKIGTKPNLIQDNPSMVIPKPVGYESIAHDYKFIFRRQTRSNSSFTHRWNLDFEFAFGSWI